MSKTNKQPKFLYDENTHDSVTLEEQPDNDAHIHNSETAIISIPDFDGNGQVDSADVADITSRANSIEGDELYHPLYDVDTNGTIDENDIAVVNETIGHDVPLIDQQVAQATQATMKYYGSDGQEQAIANGYIPLTQELQGHGIHYYNPVLADQLGNSEELNIEQPLGLNYNAKGELEAVFYLRFPETQEATPENPLAQIMIDPADDFPPTSFENITAEDWHNHQSVWFSGVGNSNPEEVYFEEDLPLETVASRLEEIDSQLFPESDQSYSPKFFMLHGWFHSINPDGTFATTNPDLAPYAPEELGAHGEHGDMGHEDMNHQDMNMAHGDEHGGGHQESENALIAGTDAEDGLFGTDQSDRINTFNGDDWIIGGLGDDSIWGGQGNDWLSGDEENAEGGDDMLYGGSGSDAIYGRVGNDRIFGGTGDDFLVGGTGDDLLRGGLGYDNLTGSAGGDEFVLVSGEGTDTIHNFEIDSDTIILYGGITLDDVSISQSDSNTTLNANDETLAVLSGVNADELIAASGDVFLVA